MKTARPVLLAVLLAGCNAAPLEYSKTGDMKSGPGLFTGASGSFGTSTKPANDAAPVAPAISEEEYREFQEWKRQREEAGKK